MSETCPSLLDTLQFLQFPDTPEIVSDSDNKIKETLSDIKSNIVQSGGAKESINKKNKYIILYRHIL